MKKGLLILFTLVLIVSLMGTISLAKSVEDLVTNNGDCSTCHQPGTDDSLESILTNGHMPVDNADEDGVKACLKCHGQFASDIGNTLHKKHLVGTPDSNEFLAGVKSGENNCVSCHDFKVKSGKVTVSGL
ncbi:MULTISPECIES: cytochrome c3 family protein [unclassified Candidatus Frackibacter]|uniref:cytochrome c3 family protein n=1 Tax=unclassified Candidatus Frackibacter TaxID=2648818 RepID=UPI000797B8DA|nr:MULTISPECIES: cytochrome c3 family protein [unclassified Candidatus Frackibacter]KXS43538.1 MAG: hypothetical protein AWU54_997 [Candidatus Frackibacter sp. T328-2]SDC53749.1 Doubled CXXCH motif (Paired_CXXCH_1) [Candidatus Frackibacter sp. WG11]SEM66066.1 Doubled CXXCH motif (Paired_CXXCH_1) [Candidatus Frackibacter sp. WG12]SFL77381.1 Doubled CXXCH motif (Paired_CXXCH_1) [Candidatus Frackibacter sp. WG13]